MMCDSRAVFEQPARHLETGQPRHLDVEEDQIGLQSLDDVQRLEAIARLTDDLDAADLSEQEPQLIARQLLVVHENGQSAFEERRR